MNRWIILLCLACFAASFAVVYWKVQPVYGWLSTGGAWLIGLSSPAITAVNTVLPTQYQIPLATGGLGALASVLIKLRSNQNLSQLEQSKNADIGNLEMANMNAAGTINSLQTKIDALTDQQATVKALTDQITSLKGELDETKTVYEQRLYGANEAKNEAERQLHNLIDKIQQKPVIA